MSIFKSLTIFMFNTKYLLISILIQTWQLYLLYNKYTRLKSFFLHTQTLTQQNTTHTETQICQGCL